MAEYYWVAVLRCRIRAPRPWLPILVVLASWLAPYLPCPVIRPQSRLIAPRRAGRCCFASAPSSCRSRRSALILSPRLRRRLVRSSPPVAWQMRVAPRARIERLDRLDHGGGRRRRVHIRTRGSRVSPRQAIRTTPDPVTSKHATLRVHLRNHIPSDKQTISLRRLSQQERRPPIAGCVAYQAGDRRPFSLAEVLWSRRVASNA
jgi:hypothetical protein